MNDPSNVHHGQWPGAGQPSGTVHEYGGNHGHGTGQQYGTGLEFGPGQQYGAAQQYGGGGHDYGAGHGYGTGQQQGTGEQYGTLPPQQHLQPYRPATQPAFQHHLAPVPAKQPIVSAGGRFGAFLLDVGLAVVTLWIGWFVWSMITWSDGQTPGKKLLGHVVADPVSGKPFDWGRMAMRQFVVGGLLGMVFNTLSFGVYFWIDSFMVLSDGQRTLHDRLANSVVVHAQV